MEKQEQGMKLSDVAAAVFKDKKASVAWLAAIFKTANLGADGLYTHKMSPENKAERNNRLDLWQSIWYTLPESIKEELRKIILK